MVQCSALRKRGSEDGKTTSFLSGALDCSEVCQHQGKVLSRFGMLHSVIVQRGWRDGPVGKGAAHKPSDLG